MTSEAHAHVRFRRAIERRALWMAEDAARELPNLPLEDALQLVHLYAERGSPKYEKAAMRWLEQAVTWQLIDRNPSDRIRNRRVRLDEDREIRPFVSWEEVEAIAAELVPAYSALPVLAGTGMRPEEALGLEWRDIDKANAVASVERVHSQGRTKPCKKSERQRRRVPLRGKVLEVLEQHPRRIGTRLVFPAHHEDDYLKLKTFYLRHWRPALRAAGVEHRGVYACRHTFAAWSIAAGVQLFYLSRIMGTSVTQIDATYGHLVPDSEEYLRGLLDSYDAPASARTDVESSNR